MTDPTPPGGPAPATPAGFPRPPVTTITPVLPRSRKRRVARVLSWIAVITSLSIVAATAVGFGVFLVLNSKIDRECVFGAECQPPGADGPRPAPAPGKALNFLLVGSDSREGATPEELRQFGTTYDPGKRTDTIVLVHLSANRDKVLLVSFPRDSWVEIPGHGFGRLNTAYGKDPERGAALLARTVENLTDIRIDHYLEVDFAGFLKMVDALGGVDVCLPRPARDKDSGINLPAGWSRIKGTQALAFVRQRKGLPRGDLDRIDRQKQFMAAMLKRATSIGILANPPRLYGFLEAAASSLTVDDGLTIGKMKEIADRVRTLDPAKITFVTAPVSNPGVWKGRQLVVELDPVAGEALYQSIRADSAVPGATPAPTEQPDDLIVPPSRIRVRVLNGTGVPGAAARARTDLQGVGFNVRGIADADADTYQSTVVRYGPTRADSARTVAAAIPGSSLQLDQSLGTTLEVVIGATYDGARQVTVSTPTAPASPAAPRPSATPSLDTTTAADEPEGCD